MYMCVYIYTHMDICIFFCIKNHKFTTSNSISTTHGSTLFSPFCICNSFLLTVSTLVPIILSTFPYSVMPCWATLPYRHSAQLWDTSTPCLALLPLQVQMPSSPYFCTDGAFMQRKWDLLPLAESSPMPGHLMWQGARIGCISRLLIDLCCTWSSHILCGGADDTTPDYAGLVVGGLLTYLGT